MNERMKKAEYLFSELSWIDDRIVNSALEVRGSRRQGVKRALVVLVAALLFTAFCIGTFIIGNIAKTNKPEKPSEDAPITFEEVLSNAANSSRAMTYGSAEDIDLFDGTAKIIWSDKEEYHVIHLAGESEQNQLYSAMKRSYERAKEAESRDEAKTLVWISLGDGRVMTPYLKNTEGNVGYGALFEYQPEIVPTSDMSDLVNNLISS